MSRFFEFYTRLVDQVRTLALTGDQRNTIIDAILKLHCRGFDEIEHSATHEAVTITARVPYRRWAMLIESTLMLQRLGFNEIRFATADDTVTIRATFPCPQHV